MLLCPCRFHVPIAINNGRPIDPQVIVAMNRKKAKQLVAEAKEIARRTDSCIGLSNALSDSIGGLIARYFPDAEQRRAFLESPEYEELDQLLLSTIKRKGLYPRGTGGNGARG